MKLILATKELISKFKMCQADLKEEKAWGVKYDFNEVPPESFAVLNGNQVIALGGITHEGAIWLLTSSEVKQLKLGDRRRFVKLIHKFVNEQFDKTGFIYFKNTVWIGNEDHLKFISSCGRAEWGKITDHNGTQFIDFRLYRKEE